MLVEILPSKSTILERSACKMADSSTPSPDWPPPGGGGLYVSIEDPSSASFPQLQLIHRHSLSFIFSYSSSPSDSFIHLLLAVPTVLVNIIFTL